MTSSPCGTCRGYGTVIATPCVTCQGQGRVRARRTVPVDIPAGVDTGLRLQMPGSGEAGPAGGPNGDLYLEIKVKHHDVFSRDGDDLLCTLEVSMTDAILGTTATVKALDGDIRLELKAGMQSADIITSRIAASRTCAAAAAATCGSASRWSRRRSSTTRSGS